MKLYAFDLDGTLIRNHLTEEDCAECDGKGVRVSDETGKLVDCDRCRARGHNLVPVAEGFDHIEVLEFVAERLAELIRVEAHIAVVTNQGGVATGWQTEEQVFDKAARAWRMLGLYEAGPRASFHVAFDYPRGPEPYRSMPPRRKPHPAMLREAMKMHNARSEATLFVGDLPTDRQAADAASVQYQHPEQFFEWVPF